MTSQGHDGADEPVDLTKPAGDRQPAPTDGDLDFDPYRFGLPDHPVPPEFAPPGYRPPPATGSSYSPYGPSSPYGAGPTGSGGATPPYAQGSGYAAPGNYQPGHGQPGQGQAGQGQAGQGYPGHPGQGYPGYPGPGYPGASYPGAGYPVPGGQPGQSPRHNHGKAVASMVCGIVSIVLCWTLYLDALLVLPAFVLGLVVLSDKRSSSRGMAWAGLICAIVGAVLAVVLTVAITHLVRECSGLEGSQLRECVQQKI